MEGRAVLLGTAAVVLLTGMSSHHALETNSCAFPPSASTNAVERTVQPLVIDGSEYFIKGICYHPVPKGAANRDFSSLAQDLALMKEAGVNTIRVYSPIDDEAVLDEIHDAGIMIILGFGFNQGGHYDIWSGSFTNYINTYKDHESILMWELGNEYNYHPEWFGSLEGWYYALSNAVDTIHHIDPARPVATAHGELPDALARSSCPNIDVWGINVYRWDNPEALFAEWAAVSSKPMYLSEAGADSYMTAAGHGYHQGSNERAQADASQKILDAVFRNRDVCSGVALFSFTDGWWKAGHPDRQDPGGSAPNSGGVPYDGAANEEYWGIVDIDRNKKKAFHVLKEKYKEPTIQ